MDSGHRPFLPSVFSARRSAVVIYLMHLTQCHIASALWTISSPHTPFQLPFPSPQIYRSMNKHASIWTEILSANFVPPSHSPSAVACPTKMFPHRRLDGKWWNRHFAPPFSPLCRLPSP